MAYIVTVVQFPKHLPHETPPNVGILFFNGFPIMDISLVAKIHLVTTIYVCMHMLYVGIDERCGALYTMAYIVTVVQFPKHLPHETLPNVGILFFNGIPILYMSLVANIHVVTNIYAYGYALCRNGWEVWRTL